MNRVLCVWLPTWATDLERRRSNSDEPDKPILLVASHANHQLVRRCCQHALRAGARPGMTLAQARAIIGPAAIRDFMPQRDLAALNRLARWANRYAPTVGIDPDSHHPDAEPDALLLDITGCAHLDNGEHPLARRLRRALSRLGLRSRIGIAPTIGSAWAASRFSDSPIELVPDDCHQWLDQQPIEALRLDADTAHALRELGLETIEQIRQLPRSALPARFGPAVLERIDQALGHAIEAILPVRTAPPIHIEQRFEGPTTQLEAIELSLQKLLERLARIMLQHESGVTTLLIELERLKEDCRHTEITARRLCMSRPSRDPTHLWKLVRPSLERIHLGHGVEAVALTVERAGKLPHRQATRWTESQHWEPGQHAGMLVDTLANRLGHDAVLRMRPVASHVPERSFRHEPTNTPQAARHAAITHQPMHRPTLLLQRPEPIHATSLVPDHPPVRIVWRNDHLQIRNGIGPERIGNEWWKPGQANTTRPLRARDYYRLQDEQGRWLWVFRQFDSPHPQGSRWFVHGLWA